jgi:hypothetical protein
LNLRRAASIGVGDRGIPTLPASRVPRHRSGANATISSDYIVIVYSTLLGHLSGESITVLGSQPNEASPMRKGSSSRAGSTVQHPGATSLLSKRRGRPSNHRLPAEIRTLALSIVRERYSDFGPKLTGQLGELEAAERVLARYSKGTPVRKIVSAKTPTTATKAAAAPRPRHPRTRAKEPAGGKRTPFTLSDQVLALANGRTQQEIAAACVGVGSRF